MSALALVVEDDPHIARLLRELLEMNGHQVAEVDDGALATSTVRSLRPDVVLLDLGLPNVSGLDVLAELKSDPDTAQIPVIVVTAWWSADLSGRASAMGAQSVIAKPFELDAVRDAVASALAGRPGERPAGSQPSRFRSTASTPPAST